MAASISQNLLLTIALAPLVGAVAAGFFGKTIGRKRSWKKAYVRLVEGQEINFAATE